uniref:Polyribonucleotide nucleotidyltransferase 1 n=1 Tax=Schistocephalus solidus TaxID=70667 RepID=A0A0X3NVQ4_SCHSO
MDKTILHNVWIILLSVTFTWSQNIAVDTKFDFYLEVWKGIAEIVPDIFNQTTNINCTQITDTSTVSGILACVKEMACTLANSSFVDLKTPLREASSVICEQPQPVTGIPQAALDYLRDSLLSKPTLLILIQSYTRQIVVDSRNASLQLTVDLARNITALSSKATINATEYQYWSLKEIIDNETTLIPTGHVFLNAYDTFFAEMTSILNNTYISADMPARNAYAPIIRNDPEIKFISNKNDMLATMIVAILRQTNNDLVLIYNDQTELDFLTRQMKALYYTTFKLDPTWEQNLERLKNVFQRKTIARSYVLLLDRKTLKETANQLLNYALIQQQMKKGVEWILFSLDFSCNDVFSHFKNTGATFYCFAQSDVFTPLEPLQPYTRKQTLAAQYIDALTYITTKSTMPNDYILQRLLFQGVQPYTNNVDSIAIFDCSSSDTSAVGSWQPGRNPPLMLTPASTSLQGRTVNVGFIQYGPFYDVFFNNGLGFSVALMQEVSRQSGIQVNPIIYPFDSNQPFGQQLQDEIKAGNIYFGATPIIVNASSLAVRSSGLVLPTDFFLLHRKPSPAPDFILILRPFSMPVWLTSVLAGAIFAVILAVYGHFTPSILKRLAEGEVDSKRSVFEVASLGVVSAFSVAKLQIIPSHLSSRMFTLFMWLFVILLIVIYSGSMMTILLRVHSPMDSYSDPYALIAATSANDLMLIKNGIGYDTLAASLQNNSLVSGYTTVNSLDEAFAKLIGDENKVLLASWIETSYMSTNSCDLEAIPYPSVSQVLLTFPISSYWEFADDINAYLLGTSSSGVLEVASTIYFETGRCFIPSFKVAEPTVLDIGGAASLFLLLLVGLIVSFLCLGIEIAIRRFKHKRDQATLIFGQTYNATVTSLKKTGVTVTIAGLPKPFFIPNNQLHPDPLKVYNALDIGLSVGSEIQLTFFGESKKDGTSTFCRYVPPADM